ncbi:MAG: hypothetical protein B7Y45_00545 [Sphingomonas sp. 28-66-16]|nr:MAG: hypothetical protein B7Y45_00545 [Sphingomonas sp. 28-66-16]
MRRWLASSRAVPALLFALVWLSASWFGSWEYNPNNSTRLFAAISLAERGDATIDEFAPLTIDKARFGAHFYLDKAPGMTLMATPVVATLYGLTGQTSRYLDKAIEAPALTAYLRLRLRAAAILSSALLTALAAVALWSLARAITGSPRAGLVAALGYGLGCPAWGWSTTIFGHAAVAALFMIAVWAIWWGSADDRPRPALAALAGAALGWAVVVEYQAVIAGSAIGLWALWRAWRSPVRWRLIGVALAGGITAMLPLIGYNLLAFGVPFKVGYEGVVGFDGMQQGLFGLTYPKADVMFELVFGLRRGLIWVAPVLAIAPLGLIRLARGPHRDVAVMAAAVILLVLLVNASYVYWDGGFSTGPRHSVPMLPLLALGLAPLWAGLERARARIGVLALLGLSVVINLAIAATVITAPDTARFPLWRPILVDDVPAGRFRDLPGQFWGWSPWAGMALYLVLALGLAALLWRASRAAPRPA